MTTAGAEVRRNRVHIQERLPEPERSADTEESTAAASKQVPEGSARTRLSPARVSSTELMTRSGRVIKAPERLDL